VSATCGLDCERQLSASGFDVRRAIAEAVRELGFEITVDQLTRIEAKRGGMLGYSLLIKKQMPVLAVFEVLPEVSSCRVVCHLTDNVKNLGKTFGINRQYRGIFDEVQGRVDLGLAGLDGAASQAFAEPVFWSRSGDIGVLEQTNALTAKAVGGAVGVAGRLWTARLAPLRRSGRAWIRSRSRRVRGWRLLRWPRLRPDSASQSWLPPTPDRCRRTWLGTWRRLRQPSRSS